MCGSCNFQNSKLTTFSSSPGEFPCQGEVPRAGPWVGSAAKSANTDDSALVCRSDCSGALPARGSLCSRQQQRTSALCSFSPVPSQVEKGRDSTAGSQRFQFHRGLVAPEQTPVPVLGYCPSLQESRTGTGDCPQTVTSGPCWDCARGKVLILDVPWNKMFLSSVLSPETALLIRFAQNSGIRFVLQKFQLLLIFSPDWSFSLLHPWSRSA